MSFHLSAASLMKLPYSVMRSVHGQCDSSVTEVIFLALGIKKAAHMAALII